MAVRLELVKFHDDTLVGCRGEDGNAWVPLKPMCEALGLDDNGQGQRLKKQSWATACVMHAVGADGKAREMLCLALSSVPMWLATIQAGRIDERLRPKLELYQREAHDVLAEHFVGTKSRVLAVLDPATLAIIEQVADRIASPIVKVLDVQGEKIHGIRIDMDEVKLEVRNQHVTITSLKDALHRQEEQRRRRPRQEDRAIHVEFARIHQRVCPMFCQFRSLFDDTGEFIGEVHHVVKVSDASLENLMVGCPDCNKEAATRPLPSFLSEAYLHKFRKTREQGYFGFATGGTP